MRTGSGLVTSMLFVAAVLATSVLTACSHEEEIAAPVNSDITPPTITVCLASVTVYGEESISIKDSQLYVGDTPVASWHDNKMGNCQVELTFNDAPVTSGFVFQQSGTLKLTVTDDGGNSKTASIQVTMSNDPIRGLENLKKASLQVDKEINLLNGITFGNGAELVKIEIELEGQKVEISDPYHYIPEYPGTCNIILSVKDRDGKVAEYKVESLTIKPLEYKAIEVKNVKPKEILPIIGQVEVGDKECYNHIEHLRIAEATRIRDMMWNYGAGNHNAEQYQQLMMKLNTGMMAEIPKGYNNYEIIGDYPDKEPSNHACDERMILNTLINHANFKVISSCNSRDEIGNFAKDNPDKINIIGVSADINADKEVYNEVITEEFKENLKGKNIILFGAGSNSIVKNGHRLIKLYQENYNLPDEQSIYTSMSAAHDKNDKALNIHIMVTIGTNKDGNADITNDSYEHSKFPVGFHPKVLFSGRAFPYYSSANKYIAGNTGNYATSYVNYVNVAMADLCFQMFAEVKDVDELLEMIRSTCLTDYITLDGQTQELQLMNPAGFFVKNLMPSAASLTVKQGEALNLEKGYYHGVVFDIPGAEVLIDGQWTAFSNQNKDIIKVQNPMTLSWRVNADQLHKLGYKQGDTVHGRILAVDDQWHGLTITKDFLVRVE